MTTHEHFINPNLWQPLPVAAPKISPQGRNFAAMPLRSRLLLTVLPTVLVPMAIATGLGFKLSQNQAKQELLKRMENTVLLSQALGAEKTLELHQSAGLILGSGESLQILALGKNQALNTITREQASLGGKVLGGETTLAVAQLVYQETPATPENLAQRISQSTGARNVRVKQVGKNWLVDFSSQGRLFSLQAIANQESVAVVSVDLDTIATAGEEVLKNFLLMGLVMGSAATGILILLARQLSQPLRELTAKAEQVSQGDLSVRADLRGTQETLSLGQSFNNLLERMNQLLGEQEALTREQTAKKENLEQDIYTLLQEVEGALEGDLTVRASLNSLEMSTVADLVNAMIDNLRDMALQVKVSAGEVNTALVSNEQAIEHLAEEAIKEVAQTRQTLNSVEEMSQSIRDVSSNASEAAFIADDTYHVTQEGTKVLDKTVESILNLRSTVGETTKKMKRLGESSQKISQVVSLIEEIALKTNLLAINASVEASRAGEQGQGFTVVAEQVGALAEQSATATKEIAQIVAAIQAETQEVTEAMELGTSMVVDSTRLVEATKQRLGTVVKKSRTIKELMQQICEATVSQVDTSLSVTDLMLHLTQQSEQRLAFSREVAQSMQTTGAIATQLETAVEQFKV